MKELVQKAIESGLIDKTTAQLLEKWRMIESGSADKVPMDEMRKSVTELATELANLVDTEIVVMPEMVLDIDKLNFNESATIIALQGQLNLITETARDAFGRFVFRVSKDEKTRFDATVSPGSLIKDEHGNYFKIKKVEKSYVDDSVGHLYCTVTEEMQERRS